MVSGPQLFTNLETFLLSYVQVPVLRTDVFLPSPSDLLVNLHECRALVEGLLSDLPNLFRENHETRSALGAALQAAFKMASPTGKIRQIFLQELACKRI